MYCTQALLQMVPFLCKPGSLVKDGKRLEATRHKNLRHKRFTGTKETLYEISEFCWGGLSILRPDWRLFVLAAIFAAFLVVGYLSDQRVLQAAGELEHISRGVETAVRLENWSIAHQRVDELSLRWPSIRRMWDLRMD